LAPDDTPHDPGWHTRRSSGEKSQVKLGRYEIVRELGKGAMGIVYLAKDPLIGRLVALKTIRASAHADDDETAEFQQRFMREAQAAGILNHPGIVTVHDIGQDQETNVSFIAMEYVEGPNLKEVMQQGKPLTFDEIGDIIAQVAEGLDFAHSKGIVHRDVKPANIILVEGNRAKITDFGIAKIASGSANLTTTGQFLGTPNYMAPEQVKGAPVDGRTDIFALGICLYECLTRRKPFGGDSLTSISYKIVHEPFSSLAELNPQIPVGYEDVVAHCLAKDPAKRYQRARDMAIALRTVIRGERPVRPEQTFADETVVTMPRDRDKMPTVEVPFPDAPLEASPEVMLNTQPSRVSAPAPAVAQAARTPREPLQRQVRKTLSNVRALPLWRRHIHPMLFFGVVLLLVAALLGGIVAVRSRQPVVPVVDTRAASQRAMERRLRLDGQALLRQGRVAEAHAKFEQLSRLAPRSPYVTGLLQRLSAMRQQEEISKQQFAQAQQQFDQGMTLYSQRKFTEAIPFFQQATTLNPGFQDAANYLKLAQDENEKQLAAKTVKKNTPKTTATEGSTATAGTTQTTQSAAAETAAATTTHASASRTQLTTVFHSPFAEGTIMVKVGSDVIARENLWEEKGRLMFRRKMPRVVSVGHELTPKNADVQIWISVPSRKIAEYHVIPAVRFNAGTSYRLTITYDQASRRFDYSIN
jgi:serine/threonine protein kinase/tetratricopeptide (TPR) repeat protein